MAPPSATAAASCSAPGRRPRSVASPARTTTIPSVDVSAALSPPRRTAEPPLAAAAASCSGAASAPAGRAASVTGRAGRRTGGAAVVVAVAAGAGFPAEEWCEPAQPAATRTAAARKTARTGTKDAEARMNGRSRLVREQRADVAVEGGAVAAREHGGRERPDRRRARDVPGQGDLAEGVPPPEHGARAPRGLGDREHPVQDDVEAVAVLALADDRRPRGDLLAAHLLGELEQPLAGDPGEERRAGELVHRRGDEAWAHSSSSTRVWSGPRIASSSA